MSGELNESQLQALAASLIELEQDLQALLAATATGAQPVKLKDNQGRLSRMDEMHNQSILIANRNVTENRLKAVRQARRRLEEDCYGYCEACDEPIAHARLIAYPEASRCIDCQSLAE